ncbi:MAG: ATP-binding protein [Polyangiales bacterium]
MLVTGARQTGKSTLLTHVFPDVPRVSLDLPSEAEAAEARPAAFLAALPKPVILDELQYAPALFRYLKVDIDNNRHQRGRYLLSGSQKFELMQGASESMAGRLGILELETLAIDELHAHAIHPSVTDFIVRGGFPELWRDPNIDPTLYHRAYLSTYLERDLRQIMQVRSLRDFERFLRLLAARSGALLNKSELAKEVGVAVSTIGDWISVLQSSGQITLLEPYYRNLTQRVIKSPKFYFNDTGLLCHLLGLDAASASRDPWVGPLFESFVIGQLRRWLATRTGPAGTLFYYRDRRGLEVDVLLESGGALTAMEIKASERPSPSDAKNLLRLRQGLDRNPTATPRPHLERLLLACQVAKAYPLSNDVLAVPATTYPDWL